MRSSLRWVLWVGLAGCGATGAGGEAVPLRRVDADACPVGTERRGTECALPWTVAFGRSRGRTVVLAPRVVDGRLWWVADRDVSPNDMAIGCEAVGAEVYTPRTRRDLAVGLHFATLANAASSLDKGVATGWRVDLETGWIVDGDDQPFMRWQAGRAPHPGLADEATEQDIADALAQVAAGEEPTADQNHCLRVGPDGALKPSSCSSASLLGVCGPVD